MRPQHGGDLLLVVGVAVGVKERDGDGLDVRRRPAWLEHGVGAREVDRLELGAVCTDALADLESQLARDQRRLLLEERVVELVPPVPRDLEDVTEPLAW